MPPKKGNKKLIEEQKKQAARLQRQKQQQEAEAERQRQAQEARRLEKQRQKMLEEQRIRIVEQKQKKYPELQARIKAQQQSLEALRLKEKWQKFTHQYYKNNQIQSTNLSTFMNMFKEARYKNPSQTLNLCEESEVYICKLEQKMLEYRSEFNNQKEEQCKNNINKLWNQQLHKLEQIMIQYANSAQQIEQKNVDEAKKKNQGNTGPKTFKPVDSVANSTPNFKIGMYIHTYSTKSNHKFAPIGIKQFGFNSDMPPKWSSNLAYVKFQWTNFDPYCLDNKQEFRIVGGVYNIEFYDLPPATKKASTIMIRKKYKQNQILTRFKLQPSVIKESFKVMYEIPKYVFMAPYKNGNKSELKIAQFDLTTQKWNILPNDSIMEYMQAQNRVVCKIPRPQPLAFVQNKCSDYPYIAWQLRTVEPGKVLLDLQLPRFIILGQQKTPLMIQFQIGPNVVKLYMDQKYDQLSDLCQEYHTPQSMLNQLSRRGIHLLPTDDEYKYTKIKAKDRQAQKNAIRDIAYCLESFTIRSEPNNTNQIRVKIKQNPEYENIFLEDQQKDWKKIRWEQSDKCWIEGRGIKQRHMNLQVLLEEHDICQKQFVDRMKYDKSFLLRKTVMKMLSLTRILSFTNRDSSYQSQLVERLKKKIIVV